MKALVAWVRQHKWETATGVLGAAVLVLGGLLVFGGDGDGPEEPTAVGSTTTSVTSTTIGDAVTTTSLADGSTTTTTGEIVVDSAVAAVVVDNTPDMGLQIGVNAADLMIETPVEGGLSRFTALYASVLPDLIGPVRSVRPVSADLLAPFQPVLFTTGGQPFVVGAVTDVVSSIITPELSIAYQSLERPRPHHVFVSPAVEIQVGGALIPPWNVGSWAGGETLTEVALPLAGGISWRYEGNTYVRYSNGDPHLVQAAFDSEPEPMTRETLIVLIVNEKSAGYTDGNGVGVPTFDVIGAGSVYVMHQGEVIEGSWSRASQASPYEFVDGSGEVISVPDGLTYLAVVPDSETIDLGS